MLNNTMIISCLFSHLIAETTMFSHIYDDINGLSGNIISINYSTDQSKVKCFRLQITVNSLSTRQL